MDATAWFIPLERAADSAASLIGSKAANLARLAAEGFRVAPGFCISVDAYDRFLIDNELHAVIQMELGRKPFEEMRWEEIWDAALRIRNRFLTSPIGEDFAQALFERIAALGAETPFAVRSSAPGEDSAERSFAGLHESFLNVVGPQDVLEAVKRVWASLWSDAALLYRKELSLDPLKSRMAILIQAMQSENCSGVAFGCDPRSGDTDRAVIEAVPGACAELVDGNIDPDRWVFARASRRLLESRRGEQPSRDTHAALLNETDLDALLQMIDRVQKSKGWSPDLEWTGRRDRLTLLQARPVTVSRQVPADANDQRPWYLTLRPGRQKLKKLCDRVAGHLIPELERIGDLLAAEEIDCLEDEKLADVIEQRKRLVDEWKKIYWDEFIPMAHGVRYLGLYYNDAVRPDDPYEFVDLLRGEDMLATRRNRAMRDLALHVAENPRLHDRLKELLGGAETTSELDQALNDLSASLPEAESFFTRLADLRQLHLDIAFDGVRLADRPGLLIQTILDLAFAKRATGAEEETADRPSAADLETSLLESVGPDRHEEAVEVLRLGKLSWRLRDDDNLLVARLESQLLRALELAIRRLKDSSRLEPQANCGVEHWEILTNALRDPTASVTLPEVEKHPPVETSNDSEELPRQLIGQPAAAGIASGQVRVIRSASDLERFREGEILVCDAIQPMMTHLVPLARAVIERRGGMLIHGAIIARELGIPCVNGVSRVTDLLTDGQLVTVDGHLGIVTVGGAEFDLELRA